MNKENCTLKLVDEIILYSKYSSLVFEFVILPVYTIYAYLLYCYTANNTGVCCILDNLISLINLLICRILTLLVPGDSGFVYPYLCIYSTW